MCLFSFLESSRTKIIALVGNILAGSATNGEEEKEKEKEKEKDKSGAKKLVVIFVASGVLILALFCGGVLFIIRRRREGINT